MEYPIGKELLSIADKLVEEKMQPNPSINLMVGLMYKVWSKSCRTVSNTEWKLHKKWKDDASQPPYSPDLAPADFSISQAQVPSQKMEKIWHNWR